MIADRIDGAADQIAGFDAEAVLELLHGHVPTLRRLGLATDRPTLLLRAPSEGVLLEIFEWRDGEAARTAHEAPEVGRVGRRVGSQPEPDDPVPVQLDLLGDELADRRALVP